MGEFSETEPQEFSRDIEMRNKKQYPLGKILTNQGNLSKIKLLFCPEVPSFGYGKRISLFRAEKARDLPCGLRAEVSPIGA